MRHPLWIFVEASLAVGKWETALAAYHQHHQAHHASSSSSSSASVATPAEHFSFYASVLQQVLAHTSAEVQTSPPTTRWQSALHIAHEALHQAPAEMEQMAWQEAAQELTAPLMNHLPPHASATLLEWLKHQRTCTLAPTTSSSSSSSTPTSTVASQSTVVVAAHSHTAANTPTTAHSPYAALVQKMMEDVKQQHHRPSSWKTALTVLDAWHKAEQACSDADRVAASTQVVELISTSLRCLHRHQRREEMQNWCGSLIHPRVPPPVAPHAMRRLLCEVAELIRTWRELPDSLALDVLCVQCGYDAAGEEVAWVTPSAAVPLLRLQQRGKWEDVLRWWRHVLHAYEVQGKKHTNNTNNNTITRQDGVRATPSGAGVGAMATHLKLSSYVASCVVSDDGGAHWAAALDAFRHSRARDPQLALLFALRALRRAGAWEAALHHLQQQQQYAVLRKDGGTTTTTTRGGTRNVHGEMKAIFSRRERVESWMPPHAVRRAQELLRV